MKKANAVKERIANLSDRVSKLNNVSSLIPSSTVIESAPIRDVLASVDNRVVDAGVDITAKLLTRLQRLNEISTEVWKRTTNLADKKIVEDVMLMIAKSIDELKIMFESRIKIIEASVGDKIKEYAESSLISKDLIQSRAKDIESVASTLKGAVSSLETSVTTMLQQNGLDLKSLSSRAGEIKGFTGNFDGVYPRFESSLTEPLLRLENRVNGLGDDDVLAKVQSEENLADINNRLVSMGF